MDLETLAPYIPMDGEDFQLHPIIPRLRVPGGESSRVHGQQQSTDTELQQHHQSLPAPVLPGPLSGPAGCILGYGGEEGLRPGDGEPPLGALHDGPHADSPVPGPCKHPSVLHGWQAEPAVAPGPFVNLPTTATSCQVLPAGQRVRRDAPVLPTEHDPSHAEAEVK